MGITGSKSASDEVEESASPEEGSVPSTPILTPKVFREKIEKEGLDPRSPSKHIARTPIEVLSSISDKLGTPTIVSTNSEQAAVETPLKRHLILGIDPRSPTVEVHRTPIIVSASPDKKLPSQIRNKYLEKVKNSNLLNGPKATPPKLLDSNPVTPKIKTNISQDAYKRKSFVLLETNIDFTETDLDTVIKGKYLGKSLQNLSMSEEVPCCEINDPRSPTTDFLRTPVHVCKSAEQLNGNIEVKKEQLHTSKKNEEQINSEEPVNPEMNVILTRETVEQDTVIEESTAMIDAKEDIKATEISFKNVSPPETTEGIKSVVSAESRDNSHVLDGFKIDNVETQDISVDNSCEGQLPKAVVDVKEPLVTETTDIVEDNVDLCLPDPIEPQNNIAVPCELLADEEIPPPMVKSAPVSPPSVVCVTPKKSKSEPVTPPMVNLTADVEELEKKLTNLIYEDKDLVVCPRVVKIKEQSRTPLGLRNGTGNIKTDTKNPKQKLKVSDKPRKAEYAVSKIPVFKEKKVKVQCENTPPRSMRTSKSIKLSGNPKPKKPQWDPKDDTLVI